MSLAATSTVLEQHPFVTRLLQFVDLDPADLKGLAAISMANCWFGGGGKSLSTETNTASCAS
jgi:hypothetical protein